MTQGITTMQGLTIGIDLGDRYSHYCVLDRDGEVLEEGRLSTTPKAFQQRFGSADPCRIALEVGTHSPWVNQLLQEAGHEVLHTADGKEAIRAPLWRAAIQFVGDNHRLFCGRGTRFLSASLCADH